MPTPSKLFSFKQYINSNPANQFGITEHEFYRKLEQACPGANEVSNTSACVVFCDEQPVGWYDYTNMNGFVPDVV